MMLNLDTMTNWWMRFRPYGIVLLVFVIFVGYESRVATHGQSEAKRSVQEEYFSEEKPTLSLATPEKMYEHFIQAKAGDVFRLGFVARSRTREEIDVVLQSSLGDRVTVGQVTVQSSSDNAYYEVVFSVPNRAEDILLHLSSPADSRPKGEWLQPEVFLSSVFMSRLDVNSLGGARSLLPTRYGLSQSDEAVLEQSDIREKKRLVWSFEAPGDSLEALLIPESLLSYDGVFSLSARGRDTRPELLTEAVLDATVRENARVRSGKYRLPFVVPLKRGERYELEFEPRADDPLTRDSSDVSVLIAYRSLTTIEGGKTMLNFARLEDLGQDLLYSFSVQNKEEDLLNVYELSPKIHFDWKKKRIAGSRKKDEYYTYRFDTLYPFERFALEARSGSTKNGMMLEYSFDNSTWQPVSIFRESGQADRYTLTLSGTGDTSVVYVRIRYTGDEKKTGSFALDRFSVSAMVNKRGLSL